MTTLHLSLIGEYFHQIKAGTKLHEYRLCTPYWAKRLVGRSYTEIVLTLGYPKAGDTERRISCPWQGYTIKTLQHEHFGPEPVTVFAIDVRGAKCKAVQDEVYLRNGDVLRLMKERDALQAQLAAAQGQKPVMHVILDNVKTPLYSAPIPQQPAEPEGWKLVPIEPTHLQAKAVADAWLGCDSKLYLNKAMAAAKAMLAAAPQPKE